MPANTVDKPTLRFELVSRVRWVNQQTIGGVVLGVRRDDFRPYVERFLLVAGPEEVSRLQFAPRVVQIDRDDDDSRAYLGTVVPQFPNFFVLYGPNTALGHGGSFIFTVECQIDYVLSALRQMGQHSLREIECRSDVCSLWPVIAENLTTSSGGTTTADFDLTYR